MCLFSLNSEPCPPTNIQANVSCGQPTATVSWQQSGLAAGYVAYFDSQRGHDTFCVGTDTDTSCVVSGLMCGTVYNVWVKALGHQYNSSDSIVVPLTSGNVASNYSLLINSILATLSVLPQVVKHLTKWFLNSEVPHYLWIILISILLI